jgi:hypothetical protein
MTAKVISLTEYKKSLISRDEYIIYDLMTNEEICELPSRIIDIMQTEQYLNVTCEDGVYIVYPDGSYKRVEG